MSAVQSGQAEIKKYQTYLINVDPNQDDKATEIKLCNFSRPHMRAFHCSWFAFFIAFFIWFAIAPLMPEITTTLGLNKQQIWTANILSVAGTILMRFVIGPLCDKYGARILMGIVLILAAIPCACTGLVQNATGLAVLRFFIGLGGSTFVMCQYWTSRMFTKEVVGKANGIVAGWGNLGGGVTQLVMGSILFPLFKTGMSAEMAWRTCPIVPAVVAIFVGVAIFYISDDAPKGNYKEMTKNGTMAEVSAAADFRSGVVNFNTWVLFIQYACCFGVELTMNNAAALYFSEKFLLTTEIAAMIASLFGWMNLFTRGLGGYISDKCNAKVGMRGRLWWQTACLVLEGLMVLVFAQCNSLTASIIVLVIFSTFVQVSEGSTFGIVPYIDSAATGSISGIVGAGGNVGAVCFGLAFRYQLNYYHDFMIMGGIIIASGVLSLFICIKGHAGLISGQDSEEAIRAWKKLGVDTPTTTLQVPVPDEDAAADIEEDA